MEYASNPKAHFDYEILETVEAGFFFVGTIGKKMQNRKSTL